MRYRRGWIALLALALLTPIGIIAASSAWGEWGLDGIRNRIGYTPRGMRESMAGKTESPLEEYRVPGLARSGVPRRFGYVITAMAGAGITAGAILLLGKGVTHGKSS